MDPKFTQEEAEQARKLVEFYTDFVENNSEQSLKYDLASNVVLDWFGKTIKDERNVKWFLRNSNETNRITHQLINPLPTTKVSFKDVHNVKVKPTRAQEDLIIQIPSPSQRASVTPPRLHPASTSALEMGQGDGLHNESGLTSPHKKMRLSEGEDDEETVEGEEPIQLHYVTAEGEVEFHKPSMKKLQTETKWKRKVKLHIGYTCNNFKDCTIYLIIYEGNMKCRRNLLKEFDASIESE